MCLKTSDRLYCIIKSNWYLIYIYGHLQSDFYTSPYFAASDFSSLLCRAMFLKSLSEQKVIYCDSPQTQEQIELFLRTVPFRYFS